MKKGLFAYFIVFLIALTFCEKEEETADCRNIMCTDILMGVAIHILNSAGNNPVQLTDYKVIRVSDNLDMTIHDNDLSDNNGYYPIVYDSSPGLLVNTNIDVEFQGFINSELVIQKQFTVKKDCCHVYLVSGETEVNI